MTTQRIALVTGANRGIGKKVARQLTRDYGLKVLLGARDLEKGQAAGRDIGGGAEALPNSHRD